MANIVWSTGSGSWGNAANWSSDTTPTANDAVQIEVPLITVSIGAGVTADAYSLTTVGATLSLAGGTLYTVSNAVYDGAFVESSGTYTAGGTGATFNSALQMTGGAIDAIAGAAFVVNDGGNLAGTFSGLGQLDLSGGTTYIDAGFKSTLSSIVVDALVGFNTNFTTSGNFTELGGGSVDLFGHRLEVTGNATIDGILGNGEFLDAGTLTLGAPLTNQILDNGLTLDVTGRAIQAGTVYQGSSDAGAKITIGATGQYDINSNWNIYDPSSIGTIVNAGIFAKTGGGKTSSVYVSFASTGTVKTGIGALLLEGLYNTISGTVSGAGTLGVAGGETTFGSKLALAMAALDQQGGILVLNQALSYGGEWDMTGGVLNLNSTATTLTLNGPTDLDGGTLSGYGGTVLLKGLTQAGNMLIGGPNTLTVSGTLDQTITITFGPSSNPVAHIEAGATWAMEGDSSIQGSFGLIDNQGLFVDPSGSGISAISSEFETTGTVTVNNSVMQFQGETSLGGTVNGTGQLDLNGPATLQSGLALTVAALDVNNAYVDVAGNLSYAGGFSETGNATLDLLGHGLTLTGTASLDSGSVTDGGTLTAEGGKIGNYTVAGGATLLVSGAAEQTGAVTISAADLTVAAGATYALDDDYSIYGTGTLDVAGALLANGTGASIIQVAVDQTGTLDVNDQLLTLEDGGALGGTIAGAGTLSLYYGTFTLQGGLNATVAELNGGAATTAALGGNDSYAGYFVDAGTLSLGTDTLSLSGTTLLSGATLTGAGYLDASGDTTLSYVNVLGGATLEIAGTAEQGPGNTFVDGGTLVVAANASYTLDANQSIFGGGVLDVAGTLTAAGNGNGVLGAVITDTGVIAANLGTLDVMGSVQGSGSFAIGAAGTLEFGNTSTITAASTINFTAGHADLIIGDMGSFGALLSDFASGDVIELTGIAGTSISGTLLAGGTQYLVTDSNHDSITLSFGTAQTASQLYVGVAQDGNAAVFHH
jgi:hypothetical protein